jgi:hypothetical protein
VFLGINMSQNTNDQGWFVIIKTKLTTKGKGKCKEREDYIYIARGYSRTASNTTILEIKYYKISI